MNPTFRFSSQTVIFFVAIWMVFQFFAIKRWASDHVWQNEMKAYYGYLPALFTLGDVGLEKTEMNEENGQRYFFPAPAKLKGHVLKTTMGVAVMQTPFFLTAHVIALCGNDAEDGFSRPYKIMAMISAIFYCVCGLILVRKTLLHFFSDISVSLVLLTLVVGTNLYFYTLHEACMSHAYSFFLVSAFVYLTVSWHRVPNGWKLLLIGFLLGLITLIRPVNVCLGIFFFLYRDASQALWKQKFSILFSSWKYILVAAFLFFFTLLPQGIYWKHLTGDWMYYSYEKETFFWLKPKIFLGLFSYQKGWLVWTPVMFFALIGIFFLRQRKKWLLWPVLLSLVVYIYIVFSWWCWWYGGGFGMRPMIDILPVLALPLAAFFQYILRSNISAYPILGVWVFLLALNIFQTNQYVEGKLHWSGTSKKVYWEMFLNNYPKEDLQPYLEDPNAEQAMQGETGLGQ